jgi:hypothetical protein
MNDDPNEDNNAAASQILDGSQFEKRFPVPRKSYRIRDEFFQKICSNKKGTLHKVNSCHCGGEFVFVGCQRMICITISRRIQAGYSLITSESSWKKSRPFSTTED